MYLSNSSLCRSSSVVMLSPKEDMIDGANVILALAEVMEELRSSSSYDNFKPVDTWCGFGMVEGGLISSL